MEKWRKAGAALLLLLAGTSAVAEPSCTNWLQQPDGSYWRTCVDDNGTQYCEQSKDGYVSRVSCSG